MLVGVGAWLRFHRLDEFPPGLWIDEALNGIGAVSIAESGQPLAAVPEDDVRTGLGAGYLNLGAVVFRLFDAADGPYAIRTVAAVLGIVGLSGLAALAWAMFGPRVALIAAGWLAVSQYHMNYSRWGCMPIMSSVVEVFALLGVLAGVRYRGWRSWLGFSVAGAGLYTYQSFRLVLVLAGFLSLLLAVARPQLIAARLRPAILAMVVALIVAAPMLRYAVSKAQDFSERARNTVVLFRADWKEQLPQAIAKSLLSFQFIGDDNPRHNLPYRPLLAFVPALLAPIGSVICVWRWRRIRYVVVPLWFAVTVLPGAITLEAPHASRLLDTVMPLALMIGIAVDYSFSTLQAALPRHGLGTGVGLVLLSVAAAVTARHEYRAYFVERERLPAFYDGFLPHEAAPGRYLETHTPTSTVYLDPATYYSPTSRFIARRYFDNLPNDVRVLYLLHDFPPRQPLNRDAVYVLPSQYTPLAGVIREMFVGARCEEERDPFGRIDLTVCTIPHAEINAALQRADDGTLVWPHGLRGRYYTSPDGSGEPYYEAVVPFLFCDYPIDIEPIGRFEFAAWDGFIRITQPGEYYFRLHPDSTTLEIDGRPIIHHAGDQTFGGGNEGHVELKADVYPIRITYRKDPRAGYFLWFHWEPPGGEAEWVPSSVLYPAAPPPGQD